MIQTTGFKRLCLMKQFVRTLFAAGIAAMAFVSCAQNELTPDVVEGKKVTVHFGTENTDPTSTKATLTPNEGETAFQAAWEVNDEISISYSFNYADPSITTGKWIGSSFEATISGQKGDWMYEAAYPVPVNDYVDFGSNRTQKGNAYNSKYDIMIGSALAENAEAGKDEAGKDIVFKMDRQTAIVYFHFTSDGDFKEAITKATLKVEGEKAAIAAETVLLDTKEMSYDTGLSEIVLTTTGQTANDFTLWFNVLPTSYTKMTLTVETATKTFTISKATSGSYDAGKLYKVKKENITWKDKPETWSLVTDASELAVGDVIVIVAASADFAMSSDRGNNRDHTAITKNADNTVTITNEVQKLTLGEGTNTNTFSLFTGSGYLYAASSSSNYLKTKETFDANGSWTITISSNNATIKANGDNTRNIIRYNSSNKPPIFSCYSSGQKEVQIYKKSGSSDPGTPKYSVSVATVTGGTLAASSASAEEGAEILLTATPDEGYAFNNVWTVKDADGTAITVTDGKFNMPAKNVTVSGSFSKVDYTITKATCEGGSFTVKKDGEEVTKAQVGDAITLEASAAPGYEFDSWTVTNESTSKTVYVSENSFTMPGANVTVSANFLNADVIPVYASVADLIKVGAPTSEGAYVTVTLTNEEITKFYTTSAKARRGVYFTVGTQEIELFGDIACPEEWVAGGWVSGTLTKCKWMEYKGTWELCPTDWTELTYAAPCETPVITLDGALATIECATVDATIRYTTDGTDPNETSAEYTGAVTLEDGQTIKAKAFRDGHKPSDIASKKYTIVPSTTVTVTSFSATSGSIDESISYSTAKGGGTSNPAINSNQIRLYQISGSNTYGGTITLSAKEGYKIQSVTIGSSMATSVSYTLDSNTTLSAKANVSENGKYSLDDISASSVTFYCMGTSSSARLYVNYISVTYSAE